MRPLTFYLVIAGLVQIIWGLTPTASKFVIDQIPVELYISLRWSISSGIFLGYVFYKKTWRKISLKNISWISLLGILGYGVGSLGTLYGLKIGGVTNFALMAAFSPIMVSLASILLLKERPSQRFYLALGMSVLGLGLLIFGKYSISTIEIAGLSAVLILGAYICEALVFVYSKKFKEKANLSQYLAITQGATAVLMWTLEFTHFRQLGQLANLSDSGMMGIGFVAIVSCVLCYATLYWLLNHVPGHKLSLFEGLHTISAVIFGYVIFNEEVRPMMYLGGVLILSALILSNLPTTLEKADMDSV